MDIGTRGGTIGSVLGGVLFSAKVAFRVSGGRVILIPRGGTTTGRISITIMRRRARVMGKVMISGLNRPMPKTGIIRGKAAGNVVASVSNTFSLAITPSTILRVSCVNCIARSISIGKGSALGVALHRSSRTLRRIIIANFNLSRGGTALANTIATINSRSVDHSITSATSNTLINGVTNLGAHRASNHPKTAADVRVHGVNSPLCIVSNIRSSTNRFGGVSFGSVRDVSMLGSTSTTVCNIHTTGNIIIIGAGGNGQGAGGAISLGTCCN